MIRTTVSKGICQSDVLIRTAIIAALEDMRENPWMLDYVFAWLRQDDLTVKTYGEVEMAEAKDWFLNTDVVVTMAYRQDRPQLPCIGIELVDSSEEQQGTALGDVHYEPDEDTNATEVVIKPRPVLSFTPKSYDSATGTVQLPDDLNTDSIFTDMVLYDAASNRGYPILEVVGDNSFTIAADTKANFTKAYIAPISSFYTVRMESAAYRETFRLRCFVAGSVTHLFFLHSVLTFILLAYKEQYLEGRGFDRSVPTAQGVVPMDGEKDGPEVIYTRDTILTGYVRQYWPKPGSLTRKIDGILVYPIKVIDGGTTPPAILQNAADQGWAMEDDDTDGLMAARST